MSGLDSARPGMLEGLASGWLALQDLGEAQLLQPLHRTLIIFDPHQLCLID